MIWLYLGLFRLLTLSTSILRWFSRKVLSYWFLLYILWMPYPWPFSNFSYSISSLPPYRAFTKFRSHHFLMYSQAFIIYLRAASSLVVDWFRASRFLRFHQNFQMPLSGHSLPGLTVSIFAAIMVLYLRQHHNHNFSLMAKQIWRVRQK